MKSLSIGIVASLLLSGCAHHPPVVAPTHAERGPQVFEKESDSQTVWRSTLEALRKAGVSHRLVRIEEEGWSARPHYGIVLETATGITIKGIVGGPLDGRFFDLVIIFIEEEQNGPDPQQKD